MSSTYSKIISYLSANAISITKEQQQKLKHVFKEKKQKDENAPKVPMSAYINFCNDHRNEWVNSHPELKSKNTEVIKGLAEMWKNASEETKKKYEDSAKQAKEEYLQKKNTKTEEMVVEKTEEMVVEKVEQKTEEMVVEKTEEKPKKSKKTKEPTSASSEVVPESSQTVVKKKKKSEQSEKESVNQTC